MPALVSPRVPVAEPSVKTPLKGEGVLPPTTVNIAGPAPLLVTVPLPESEPIVLLNPFRSNTDTEVTVYAELALNAVAEPACSVPEPTLVAPV